MAGNKNTMIPTYESTYENMSTALSDGTINSPCWVYLTDQNSLVFIHYEKVDGVKTLVPHIILMDKISTIETQVSTVETKVDTATSDIQEIKTNGATVLITTETNGGE